MTTENANLHVKGLKETPLKGPLGLDRGLCETLSKGYIRVI